MLVLPARLRGPRKQLVNRFVNKRIRRRPVMLRQQLQEPFRPIFFKLRVAAFRDPVGIEQDAVARSKGELHRGVSLVGKLRQNKSVLLDCLCLPIRTAVENKRRMSRPTITQDALLSIDECIGSRDEMAIELSA